MKAAHKIILTAAIVLALGVWQALLRIHQSESATTPPRPAEPSLPAIALGEDDARHITKLEITRPDDDDNTRRLVVTIERRGQGWEVTAPIVTEASRAAVEEAIRNLTTLHLWKEIDPTARSYAEHDLTDGKALHIAAWHGGTKVVDLICGKGSVAGQLVRLPDRDGVFALVNWGPQGYQGFLFTRDVRSWRETSIFKFAPEDTARIDITNPHGVFGFAKEGDKWIGFHASRPGGALRPLTKLDSTKIDQLLRDYQSLAADNFGDRALRASSGVDDAEQTGGVIRIQLAGGVELTLRVGRPANDGSRFAIKNSRWATKDGGDGTLYFLSPYTAGWATADVHKFE